MGAAFPLFLPPPIPAFICILDHHAKLVLSYNEWYNMESSSLGQNVRQKGINCIDLLNDIYQMKFTLLLITEVGI